MFSYTYILGFLGGLRLLDLHFGAGFRELLKPSV